MQLATAVLCFICFQSVRCEDIPSDILVVMHCNQMHWIFRILLFALAQSHIAPRRYFRSDPLELLLLAVCTQGKLCFTQSSCNVSLQHCRPAAVDHSRTNHVNVLSHAVCLSARVFANYRNPSAIWQLSKQNNRPNSNNALLHLGQE